MQPDAGPRLLQDWIARAAARDPAKPWLVAADDERIVSYGELKDFTGRMATFLRERGLGRNDRVALLSNNSVEHLLCYFGVMAYGATICTVHVEMNRHQLDSIFERLRPKLVLYDESLQLHDLLATVSAPRLRLGRFGAGVAETLCAEVAARVPSQVSTTAGEDDDAVILFTSGTSDKPKGVVLNYREHLLNIDPTADGFGITVNDRVYDFRSLNWASAQLLGALVPVNRGATLVMAQKFSASRFFTHLRQHRATVAAGNPTTLNILLHGNSGAHRSNLPSLRFITSSSAPLIVEEWQRFEQQFGIPIAQGYGSSETGWMAAIPGEIRRLGTVGRPFPYHKLAIVDDEGRPVGAAAVGQIEIGGFPNHEYRSLAEDGRIVVNGRGRLLTGDLGTLDDDGFLRVTGRAKDLIIRGGVNISPLEIDNYLMRHPALIEAATIGVPDPVYGEEVVCYVVARPNTDINTEVLLRYCTDGLPNFKAPKRIVLTSSLPKTERGKLDRRALAQRWSRDIGA
ncbi:MAG: acyl--CoA ligase [Hyphomicrobiales bacterium]|nr:acyl--CoA ligase [Hyphomicrobiales bacterium]